MKLILGDEFSLLKEIKTNETMVLDTYGDVDPNKEIVSIINSSKSIAEKPILFITELKNAYVFDWSSKTKTALYSITDQSRFTSAIHKTIQGKSVVIASKTNNSLSILKYSDDYLLEHLDSIENIVYNKNSKLVRIETSSYRTNKEREKGIVENVICLYENAPLALYDITAKQFSWKAKNVPNDELGLVIPMHDTNACQLDTNPSVIYASTAYGDIRTYNINVRNTPVNSVNVTPNRINRMILVNETYVVVGDTKGYCALLDARKNMNLVRTFKGNTSSIRDIVHMPTSSLIAVCGYDRFVRWYDFTNGMSGNVYVKNKCTKMCFIEKAADDGNEEEEDDEKDGEEEFEEYDDDNEEKSNEEDYDDNKEDEQTTNQRKTKRKKSNEYSEDDDDNENERISKPNQSSSKLNTWNTLSKPIKTRKDH